MNSHPQSEQKHLVFYFQVHQPRRLKKFGFFDIGAKHEYFDDQLDEEIMNRVALTCYLPTNALLLELINANPAIKIAFSISGTALEQFEKYTPEVIESFKALAATGSVEFLAETSYHSLASMIPGDEFQFQVKQHSDNIEKLFGVRPSVFRNTELLYNDEIGRRVIQMGFSAILAEGVEHVLGDRSPYQVYHHFDGGDVKLLLRSNRLSDDIAFRFHHGAEKLTATQYMTWMNGLPDGERIVLLGMDYETFGEHHKKDTGIHAFIRDLLTKFSADPGFILTTPSAAAEAIQPTSHYSTEEVISWADKDKDVTAWLGNDMQLDAFHSVVRLEADVKKSHNASLLETWRNLMTSDHFYYMATKGDADGNVHTYFSHYRSPYEAFINYMNILSDFEIQIKESVADYSEVSKLQEQERRTHLQPVWVEERAAAYRYEAAMSGR